MSDTENRDQVNPDQYINTEHIEHIEDDDSDIKPPIDVTPPIDQSLNVSATDEPELLPEPEPEKPGKKKGIFGKKDKKDKEKKEKKEKPPKEKKEKKEKSGGDSGEEGAGSKLKGLFKKNKKDDTTTIQINGVEEDPVTLETPVAESPMQPGGYPTYPAGYLAPQRNQVPSYSSGATPAQTGPKSISSYLHRPPKNYQKEGCAEIKEPPKKSLFRCSNFIVVLLILGCIAGIIMTAAAGGNNVLNVVGPFFIGVSLFALIGKVFLTLFWNREAHPILKPAAKTVNKKMKEGPNYQQQQYAMSSYNYPRSSAYNQAYDTTPQDPPPPFSLTAPSEYMSEDDFTPYSNARNYHEEPVPGEYGYDADGQYEVDMKEEDEMRKDYEDDVRKDYDEVDFRKDLDKDGVKDEEGGARLLG